jgi:hypothetical protein
MRRLVGSAVFAGCTLVAGSIAAASPAAGSSNAKQSEPAIAVQAVQPVNLLLPGLRDEAAMVLVGAALIALGSVVRRAA